MQNMIIFFFQESKLFLQIVSFPPSPHLQKKLEKNPQFPLSSDSGG